MKFYYPIISLFSILILCHSCSTKEDKYPDKVINLSPERGKTLAMEIPKSISTTVAEGLELSLWASDSLVEDPIAISIDPKGRIYYTSATRQANSEFDIRGHRDWMTASISFQSVEDRRKFLRETFSTDKSEENKWLPDLNEDGIHDWKDLAVEKEQVWRLSDEDGDGYADQSRLYLEDFNEEVTDVANGILVHDDNVYIAVGPDLWKTKDIDNDGIADETESLSHGYAIHIGFSGHGMSGVTVGPAGRIWWGIGDIGMNVVDKEGKNWKYPNQGVIVRCEPDGSNFEVFAAGVRNTHEFVFDKYGNLITEDNDGDHSGERERLVYIVDGSDSGWRSNWQYGKYTDPDNNKYKVWMDEKMSIPRWEGQAAYIVPPIANYVNGPTGMVYNPGTALGEKWYDHFFIAEFRGSPAYSPIHAFTLKAKGAGFELDKTEEVVRGVLPTGLDFGPDGALYFADWIDGWGTKDNGRIWKLDVPGESESEVRKATKDLMVADFKKLPEDKLGELLSHQDMRIRLKSQFELVKRQGKGYEILYAALAQKNHQLKRIHGIWGINQLARKNIALGEALVEFLQDEDEEIIAQAAKAIGDIKYADAGTILITLLAHSSDRVKFFAAEALGQIKSTDAILPICDMLIANDDADVYLRHAGSLALARIGNATPLIALINHPSRALRIAAVVVLRRMNNQGVAEFLKDTDEYIVTEAARAINDDFSIIPALPALGMILNNTSFSGEALIRRAINANLRVGEKSNVDNLLKYTLDNNAPSLMRAEALEALSTWAKPSELDRVDGRYRGKVVRNKNAVVNLLQPVLPDLMTEVNPLVQVAAVRAASRLKIKEVIPEIFSLLKISDNQDLRVEALKALHAMDADQLKNALEIALSDTKNKIRPAALKIIPNAGINISSIVNLFEYVIEDGSIVEKQAVFASLATMQEKETAILLGKALNDIIENNLEEEVHLDVIDAIEQHKDEELLTQLTEYYNSFPKDDPLAEFRTVMNGGNSRRGENIFNWNEAAQCTRCHTIWEWGGDAGPELADVASRLSREAILESLVLPSKTISTGYAFTSLVLKDGTKTTGIIASESESSLSLKVGKEEIVSILKTDISHRTDGPSSMPSVAKILSKKEIRDLVEFLSGLKAEHG